MRTKSLLNCPFCNGQAIYSDGASWGRSLSYVQCEECGASTSMEFTKEKALKLWNKRVKHENENR